MWNDFPRNVYPWIFVPNSPGCPTTSKSCIPKWALITSDRMLGFSQGLNVSQKESKLHLKSLQACQRMVNVLTQKILPSICCVGNVKVCSSLCEQSCIDLEITMPVAGKKKCTVGPSIMPWRPVFISWAMQSIWGKNASKNLVYVEHRPGPVVMP